MNKKSFNIYFILYGVALVITLFCGTMLKLYSTDPVTGFVNLGSQPYDKIISIVYKIALGLPIVLWFIINWSRRTAHDFPVSYRHISTSIFSMLTGVAMIAYTFASAGNQVLHSTYMLNRQSTTFAKVSYYVIIVSGVMGGIAMIVAGLSGKYTVTGAPGALLGFFPALWQLLLLLIRFNSFYAVTKINDVLLMILFMCFAAFFLIGQSRIIFGLGIRTGKTYAIPSGFTVSLVGLNLVVPNFIRYFVKGDWVNGYLLGMPEALYVLALSLYAIVFLGGYLRSIKFV